MDGGRDGEELDPDNRVIIIKLINPSGGSWQFERMAL
jgi:hypothetical protein